MRGGSRVAVVGAYGAGKTTLVGALSGRLGLPVAATSAMRDPVRGVPRVLADCSPVEVFQLALRRFDERVREESVLGDRFLSDGSVLHEWVYLAGTAAARRGDGPDLGPVARRATREIVQGLSERYDLVVYVPPEEPLPADSPIDGEFQSALDRRTRAAVRLARVEVVTAAGGIEERVARVLGRLAR